MLRRFLPVVLSALVACSQAAEPPADAHPYEAAPETMALSAEGTRFDPAIPKEQVPDGAWMCDMGSVHYARSVEGDGQCPVCGMGLKHHEAHAAR